MVSQFEEKEKKEKKEKKEPLVFFGTPALCLPYLEQLHNQFDIRLIVTQPDSKGGRRKQVIQPPVKIFALEHNIPVIQPHSFKEESIIETISAVEPVLGVVIAYGKLIPKRIFRIPKCRTVNVHFSMLPLYRGAAPVQRGLENGDPTSGITIFEIVRKLDAGKIWAQKEMPFLPDDTTETVWKRMSEVGAPFLTDTIHNIISGTIQKQPQDHDRVTLAPPILKEEGQVSWDLTAQQLYNKFRAFTPWPGLCCTVCGKMIKLTQIKPMDISHDQQPGDVFCMDKKSLQVCCGEGTVLEVFQLQPQGKKPMTPHCYCMGNQLPDCLK